MSSDNVRLVSYQENRRVSEPKILKTRQISLGKLLRMYRERDRERLSRQALAEIVGVSSRTIRNWENDISLPTAHHLRKLIEVYLEQKLFSPDEERDEARELWLKRQEYDELNTFSAFDEIWFGRLLESSSVAKQVVSNQEVGQPSTTTPALLVATNTTDEGTNKLPGNLPTLNGPTIGREKELARLESLLQDPTVRLITLVGPGGVGKTRLILQTGHLLAGKFTDGVFFVCLAAIEEPALVLEMIAQTLEVKEAGNLSLLQSLQTYLAAKKILLIIDNFEQVKSAAPSLLGLQKAAPDLTLLIGSRISLQLYGEYIFEVPPLALPPVQTKKLLPVASNEALTLGNYGASELLLYRARQVKPDLTVTAENRLALIQICQRLDGLPLALELAAALLKFFTPQALLRRLEGAYNSGPLQLLEKGGSDRAGRQQSLRQTLDWSYKLLNPIEQQLFCALAIFNDGCSLAACETVCANLEAGAATNLEPSKILNVLTQLVEKSLLRYENDLDGEPRFTMLQTVREYALERLKGGGIEEVLWQRCTDYFVKLTETAEAQLRGPEQAIWAARLEKEHNNLRAVLYRALEQSQVETALRLVASLCWFWELRGYLSEGLRWAEEALAKSEPLLTEPTIEVWRAHVLNGAGMLALYHDQYLKGKAYLEETIAIRRKLGDKRVATALNNLGLALTYRGEYKEAADYFLEALELCRQTKNEQAISSLYNNLGMLESHRGNYTQAEVWFEQAREAYQKLGNKRGLGKLYNNLGEMAGRQGRYTQAENYLKESLVLHRDLEDIRGIALCLANLAQVALHENNTEKFVWLYGAIERLRASIGANMQDDEKEGFEQNVTVAREQLGLARFKQLWETGQSLSLEQVIAKALETSTMEATLPERAAFT